MIVDYLGDNEVKVTALASGHEIVDVMKRETIDRLVATYRNHHGHAKAVEIVFDPARIGYRQLLEFFFQIHDPSTRDRQGNDVGSSYRSAIFYTSEEQKRIAQDTSADVDAASRRPPTEPVCGPQNRVNAAPARLRLNQWTTAGDGASHGADIDAQGNGTATGQRLYQLIRQPGPIVNRLFEIEFLDPAVEAFAFTFG